LNASQEQLVPPLAWPQVQLRGTSCDPEGLDEEQAASGHDTTPMGRKKQKRISLAIPWFRPREPSSTTRRLQSAGGLGAASSIS
jgi:hypothetical protein